MAIDYTRRSGESTPSQAPVSLSKITLTKSAPTVNLAKAGERQGNMRVNLNWSQGAPPKKTRFSRQARRRRLWCGRPGPRMPLRTCRRVQGSSSGLG